MSTQLFDILKYGAVAMAAFVIGAMTLLGIGGGPLLVPVLIYLLGLSDNVARGTSLALIIVSSALSLLSRIYIQNMSLSTFFDFKAFLVLAIPLAIGALFISSFVQMFTGVNVDISPTYQLLLRRIFGVLLVGLGIIIVWLG
jgi:uncharacterized membrane protein YfcA